MRTLITGGNGQLGRALVSALAVAVGGMLLASCGGADGGSDPSPISQEQLDAWAEQVWQAVLPAISNTPAEGCPEDPSQTPSLSIALTGSASIELTGQVIYDSPGTTLPDIPEESRPAVGRLLAEKIYEFCRSQAQGGE